MGPIFVSTFLNFYYDVINQLKSAEGKIMKVTASLCKISAQNAKKWLTYLISESIFLDSLKIRIFCGKWTAEMDSKHHFGLENVWLKEIHRSLKYAQG